MGFQLFRTNPEDWSTIQSGPRLIPLAPQGWERLYLADGIPIVSHQSRGLKYNSIRIPGFQSFRTNPEDWSTIQSGPRFIPLAPRGWERLSLADVQLMGFQLFRTNPEDWSTIQSGSLDSNRFAPIPRDCSTIQSGSRLIPLAPRGWERLSLADVQLMGFQLFRTNPEDCSTIQSGSRAPKGWILLCVGAVAAFPHQSPGGLKYSPAGIAHHYVYKSSPWASLHRFVARGLPTVGLLIELLSQVLSQGPDLKSGTFPDLRGNSPHVRSDFPSSG